MNANLKIISLLFHFWHPSIEKMQGNAMIYKDYIDLIAQRDDFKRPQSEIDELSEPE